VGLATSLAVKSRPSVAASLDRREFYTAVLTSHIHVLVLACLPGRRDRGRLWRRLPASHGAVSPLVRDSCDSRVSRTALVDRSAAVESPVNAGLAATQRRYPPM